MNHPDWESIHSFLFPITSILENPEERESERESRSAMTVDPSVAKMEDR